MRCKKLLPCHSPLGRFFGRPNLLHGALFRLLFRTPAQKLCPMAEAPAGKVVVLELADKFWLEREPLRITRIACPAAGTARSLAGKSFTTHIWVKNRLQFFALFTGKAGAEANVI